MTVYHRSTIRLIPFVVAGLFFACADDEAVPLLLTGGAGGSGFSGEAGTTGTAANAGSGTGGTAGGISGQAGQSGAGLAGVGGSGALSGSGGSGANGGSSGAAGSGANSMGGAAGSAGGSAAGGTAGDAGAAGDAGNAGVGGVGGNSASAGTAGDAGSAGNSGNSGSSGTGGLAGTGGSAGAGAVGAGGTGGSGALAGTSGTAGQGAGGTGAMAGTGGAVNTETIRVMAANLTTGNFQSYDPGEGIRIINGLKPDIVMVQEFNYSSNTDAAIQTMVDNSVGVGAYFYREGNVQIPNGVISKFPLISAGQWIDQNVSNRSFVWAQIDIPGDIDLWAVSVHLLTANATVRNEEAVQIVSYINANIPAGDYFVLGGDFNTNTRSEPCITTFASIFATQGPYPLDQNANGNTNAGRTKPYDWVLAKPSLDGFAVPVVIGSNTFVSGLVFDSRVYSPIDEVPPILANDSGAPSMQHMGVVRDFAVPVP